MNLKKEIDFSKWRIPRNLLVFQFLFSAISGSVIFMVILKNLSTSEHLFQENLSVEKTVFLLAVLLVVLFFYTAAIYFRLRSDQAERIGVVFFENQSVRIAILRISGIAFLLCWIGYFLSPHLVFEGVVGYFLLVKPILLWGCLFFISIILVAHLGAGEEPIPSMSSSRKMLFQPFFVVIFLFLIFFVLVMKTGIGVSVREDYWYGAGIPVLWIQLVFSLFVGAVFSWTLTNVQYVKRIIKIDIVIFLLIWLVAAYFWGKEPLQSSHFMPDTGVNEMFPYSDGATFDVGSQYALIGQGLFNGQYFDRSLYSALLTYLHVFAGQNTEQLMLFQAVVFAVFPAILYLIGKELYGRTFGVTLAILILFRGINAISGSSLIDSAGPKMMLTDFPTAIGISLIILLVLKWMKNPQKIFYMVWAGCSIGLTLLLRTHAIFLLPFIVAFIVNLFKNRKVFWIYGVTLLIVGMFISTLPLDIQNQKKGVPIFYMYYSRIQLVLKERYGHLDDSSSKVTEKPKVSLLIGRERLVTYRGSEKPVCDSKYCAVVNHVFHNLVTSVLSLPASFRWDDFQHTVKESAPYWQQNWIGDALTGENYLLLLVNLTLIAFGVGAAWEKLKYISLFPLMIYFVYLLSNSLAFTSGGRYLTPVDWIVYVYFLMGVLKFFIWGSSRAGFDFSFGNDKMDSVRHSALIPLVSVRNLIGSFVAVFMIGSLVPLTDTLFPQRYQDKTTQDVLVRLDEQGLWEETNLTQADISEFFNHPDARLTSGRLLYPRFYASDEGEYGLDYPYTSLDYRRLVFLVIGSLRPGVDGVVFPVENLIPDLHASDVIVIGCATNHFLDAAVVFILSEPKKTYIRSADLVLQCPLPSR